MARFRTSRHSDVFDAATNAILRVPEALLRALPALMQGAAPDPDALEIAPDEVDAALRLFRSLQDEAGILVPQQPDRFVARRPADADDGQKLFSHLLSVTEACNIRCSNCVYGGAYDGKRKHNNARMSPQTARRAIDHLAAHSARAEYPFRMTSIALLWTEEILDFLAEYEVDLVVSLDGPREVHDRNRVGPKQDGTFDRVMANLERLQQRHPDYFLTRVSLNAVATAPLDLVALDRFFSRFPIQVSISSVEPRGFAGAGPAPIEAVGWPQMREKFLKGCLERVFDRPSFKREGYNFVYYLFIRDMQRLRHRVPMAGFPEELASFGNCVPGVERVFVNARGDFETCEKTDGCALMTLGDLETGIDPAKGREIHDRFNGMAFEHCRSCFNLRQCRICFAHASSATGSQPENGVGTVR